MASVCPRGQMTSVAVTYWLLQGCPTLPAGVAPGIGTAVPFESLHTQKESSVNNGVDVML